MRETGGDTSTIKHIHVTQLTEFIVPIICCVLHQMVLNESCGRLQNEYNVHGSVYIDVLFIILHIIHMENKATQIFLYKL